MTRNEDNATPNEGKKNKKFYDKPEEEGQGTERHEETLGSNIDPDLTVRHCEENDMNN